jgi:GxxExxY protein
MADNSLKYADLTEAIIGSFYDVYHELGHGFLESVYRESMAVALVQKGLQIEREKMVQVSFRGSWWDCSERTWLLTTRSFWN